MIENKLSNQLILLKIILLLLTINNNYLGIPNVASTQKQARYEQVYNTSILIT